MFIKVRDLEGKTRLVNLSNVADITYASEEGAEFSLITSDSGATYRCSLTIDEIQSVLFNNNLLISK